MRYSFLHLLILNYIYLSHVRIAYAKVFSKGRPSLIVDKSDKSRTKEEKKTQSDLMHTRQPGYKVEGKVTVQARKHVARQGAKFLDQPTVAKASLLSCLEPVHKSQNKGIFESIEINKENHNRENSLLPLDPLALTVATEVNPKENSSDEKDTKRLRENNKMMSDYAVWREQVLKKRKYVDESKE